MNGRDAVRFALMSESGMSSENAETFTQLVLNSLESRGFAVVKLPEADPIGTYSECAIEGGDEIAIDRPWVNPRQARILAADLLRAAAQIEEDRS